MIGEDAVLEGLITQAEDLAGQSGDPKLKLLTTSASMLVSVAAYSLIWGWQFAAGFVLLLLVHEMGHVIQLRREGVPASAPLFIPFLGAVVGMKQAPKDAATEARVERVGLEGHLRCAGAPQPDGGAQVGRCMRRGPRRAPSPRCPRWSSLWSRCGWRDPRDGIGCSPD